MKYLMIICNDGIAASDAEEELIATTFGPYTESIADVHLYGRPLQGPETAATVRVRDGQTLITDGPFVESREHIAGFSIIECEDREQAIEVAAAHPLAWFHRIELRPLADEDDGPGWTAETVQRLHDGPPAGRERYLMMICSDGVASDAKRATMQRKLPGYVQRLRADGAFVAGNRLQGPETACTVRMRGPHTLVTDGPFTESREFLAGFDVVEADSRATAIALAAAHPVAWFHRIELRALAPRPCGAADEADALMEVAPA